MKDSWRWGIAILILAVAAGMTGCQRQTEKTVSRETVANQENEESAASRQETENEESQFLDFPDREERAGNVTAVDLNGDGNQELIYLSGSSETDGEATCLAVWEKIDGKWEKLEIDDAVLAYGSGGEWSYLTLYVELMRLDETHLQITETAGGLTEVSKWDKESLDEFCDRMLGEETSCVTRIYSDSIRLEHDPETGEVRLLATGSCGNKWVKQSVTWSIGYVADRWEIQSFSVEHAERRQSTGTQQIVLTYRELSVLRSFAEASQQYREQQKQNH